MHAPLSRMHQGSKRCTSSPFSRTFRIVHGMKSKVLLLRALIVNYIPCLYTDPSHLLFSTLLAAAEKLQWPMTVNYAAAEPADRRAFETAFRNLLKLQTMCVLIDVISGHSNVGAAERNCILRHRDEQNETDSIRSRHSSSPCPLGLSIISKGLDKLIVSTRFVIRSSISYRCSLRSAARVVLHSYPEHCSRATNVHG